MPCVTRDLLVWHGLPALVCRCFTGLGARRNTSEALSVNRGISPARGIARRRSATSHRTIKAPESGGVGKPEAAAPTNCTLFVNLCRPWCRRGPSQSEGKVIRCDRSAGGIMVTGESVQVAVEEVSPLPKTECTTADDEALRSSCGRACGEGPDTRG